MRTFVAIDISEEMRRRITLFVDETRASAPDVRWMAPESWHITLKFIGEKSAEMVQQIENALKQVNAHPLSVRLRGCGFFPNEKAARVFWAGIEAVPELADLASTIDQVTATFGITKEEHSFNPHLTLARAGSAAPGKRSSDRTNRRFAGLQEKLSKMSSPDFGVIRVCEFILYESKTTNRGAQYFKLACFPLNS